jgi:hypothetical protein
MSTMSYALEGQRAVTAGRMKVWTHAYPCRENTESSGENRHIIVSLRRASVSLEMRLRATRHQLR